MKKITLSFLATVTLLTTGYSQAVYNLVAPANNNATSYLRAPNGTSAHANQRSVMFIHEWELLPMNLSTINTIGFQYKNGTGSIPVIGNFTLYLENTTDTDHGKPNSFSAITSTMSTAYVGTYTVPGSAGAATVNLNLTTPFNYTGGGLYVAWDFQSAGPFATAPGTLVSNSRANWIYFNNSPTAPVNTFTAGNVFRPSLLINAANTATNEIEMLLVEAPGKVSKLEGATQDIYATLMNSSIGAQTNVTVTLNSVGANAYSTSTVIPSMAAGAITTLTFSGYNPTANGQSSIAATVMFADQVTSNNVKVWTQSVTCNKVALFESKKPASDFIQYTVGGGGNIVVFEHTTGSITSSITSVSCVPPSFTTSSFSGNLGTQAFAVLADASGNIIATGNTVTLSSPSMLDVWTAFPFATTQSLSPNTTYLFGIGTPTSGSFPVGTDAAPYIPGFYLIPAAGGSVFTVDYGWLSLEATLTTSNVVMTASATRTRVCKGESTTLNAIGTPTTFIWSASGVGTASSAVVSPTLGGSGVGMVSYSVSGTDPASGCKTNFAVVQVSVAACLGVVDNKTGDIVNLFPNPSSHGITSVTGLQGTSTISVFNTLGQLVLTVNTSEESASLDLSNQSNGNYIVKITNSNNETRILKMVNQH